MHVTTAKNLNICTIKSLAKVIILLSFITMCFDVHVSSVLFLLLLDL